MTDSQPALPEDLSDLTPEMAREAPPDHRTDRLVLQAIGIDPPLRDHDWMELHEKRQPSRTAKGAYRLRQHIQEQPIDIGYLMVGVTSGRPTAEMEVVDGDHWNVYGPTEHVALCRLFLLLIAEGVIEVPG